MTRMPAAIIHECQVNSTKTQMFTWNAVRLLNTIYKLHLIAPCANYFVKFFICEVKN